MENVRKHRDIVTAEKRRKYLVPEPNNHTTKFFTKCVGCRNKKLKCLSILALNKIVMYEFLYDYVKPKYGEKAKLRYTDT